MKKKIIGIFIVMLLIASVLPVMGFSKEDWHAKEKPSKELMVNRQENLAPNPSFEEGTTSPTGWEHTDYGHGVVHSWDSNEAHSGEKSVGVSNYKEPRYYCTWFTTELIPVEPLEHGYELSVWYKYIGEPAESQYAIMRYSLYDVNQEPLNRNPGLLLPYSIEWRTASVYTSHYTGEHLNKTKYVKLSVGQIHFNSSVNPNHLLDVRFDDVFFGLDNPPNKPTIAGPTSGKAGTSYTYTFNAVDPDGDDVRYIINWGDDSDTTPFNPSGIDMLVPHTWPDEGTYIIRASAEDTEGLVGPETTLEVNMPKNRAVSTQFLNFLQQYPLIYQLLQRLLKL